MIIIIFILILFIGIVVGIIMASDEIEKLLSEVNYYKELANNEIQKNVRIDSVIRKARNKLLYRQTELRNTPKEKQQNKALDYIGVNANVKLITKLEEAIRNEM